MKTSTINKTEISKFNRLATEWWDPEGSFKPLHKFNPIRIKYIKDKIVRHFNIKSKKMPLKNINILDVGCGGGLISVPMKRLGANVVGIDASLKNINVAKIYSKKKKLGIKYICSSPEKLNLKKKFDVLLMLEIVEHVDDVNFFIRQSSRFLKKNGLMFIATLNKTLKSYVFAIVGAEYILNWLPIGTHDWEKFVNPEELINITKNYKFSLIDLSGLKFNPLSDSWALTGDKSVNYIANFRKN
tara:strand:- start:2409 stop:3137 length:729 start_codon:yes stop_codon:yes gene_type:complete